MKNRLKRFVNSQLAKLYWKILRNSWRTRVTHEQAAPRASTQFMDYIVTPLKS